MTSLLAVAVAAASPVGADVARLAEPALAVEGAQVWDGAAFVSRTLFVAGGEFVAEAPGDVQREIDGSGLWIVPPLADAHTHRFSTVHDAAEAREMFLRSGALYAANLCSPSDARAQCADYVGGETGIDVIFSNGGLTATDGHPVRLYEHLHSNVYGEVPDTFWEQNNDNTFYIVDDASDLAAKWPSILAHRPDVVKVLLSHSEEFDVRRDDPGYYGKKGLDPALVPRVVERARAAGLRVFAHVDTAADFRHAVEAGVDVIAHTPGYGSDAVDPRDRYVLTANDARIAAERGVAHVTTCSIARSDSGRSVTAENVAVLAEAGVPIAIGSDQWFDPLAAERAALAAAGIFEPEELLRAWCEVTPRLLFPDRSLGRLEPGYEGSFVALAGDPLADLEHLGQVRLVVKRGRVLWERTD